MKHWFDLSKEERAAMSHEEKDACMRASAEHDIELMELVKAGLWVRTRYQTIMKLPNCHDFGFNGESQ